MEQEQRTVNGFTFLVERHRSKDLYRASVASWRPLANGGGKITNRTPFFDTLFADSRQWHTPEFLEAWIELKVAFFEEMGFTPFQPAHTWTEQGQAMRDHSPKQEG